MKIKQRGFTLLEIILVISLILMLAGVVTIVINPNRQLADSRNMKRLSDINIILDAVYQYTIDGNVPLPTVITSITNCATSATATATNEICKTGAVCKNLVDLSILKTNAKCIASLPYDPKSSTMSGTDYFICKDSTSNRLTVTANNPENGTTISATR